MKISFIERSKFVNFVNSLCVLAFLLWHFLPIFPFYFRPITYFFIIVFIVLFNFELFMSTFHKNFILVFSLLLYFIIFSFFYQKVYGTSLLLMWNSIYLISPFFPLVLLLNSRVKVNHFYIILIVIVGITSISTFFYLDVDPLASRNLSFITDIDNSYFSLLMRNNVGGYEFIYFIPLITISLVKFRNSTFSFFSFLLSFFFLLLVIKSQYTLAIFFQILAILYLIFLNKFKFKNFFLFFIFLALFVFVFRYSISFIIIDIAGIFESTIIKERLIALSNILIGDFSSNPESIRIDLYISDLNIFLNNPLFGSLFEFNITNNHSEIFSSLAKFGVSFVFIYIMLIKYMKKVIVNENFHNFLIFFIIVTGIFNPIQLFFSFTFLTYLLSNKV